MNTLQEWKENQNRISFDKWKILEGLTVRDSDFEHMELEGNIDGKFVVFCVTYDAKFDGVMYYTTLELIKEEELVQ